MLRIVQSMLLLWLASATVVICSASDAKHAYPKAFGAILNGADSVSVRDREGRVAPCNVGSCTLLPDAMVGPMNLLGHSRGAPTRLPWLVEIVSPSSTHYVIRCVGCGGTIDLNVFVVLPGGRANTGTSIIGVADSTYEWAIDWQVLKGDSACC